MKITARAFLMEPVFMVLSESAAIAAGLSTNPTPWRRSSVAPSTRRRQT
jgi:hypothetical protein